MASTLNPRLATPPTGARQRVGLFFAALAALTLLLGVGAYFSDHQSYHCPTVTVATARC